MLHHKKVYTHDYTSLLINLERFVPKTIENALVVEPGEGHIPVWLFENRPSFITVACSQDSACKASVLFERNTEEFHYALARLDGDHLDSLEVLHSLPTRYDLIYYSATYSNCFTVALGLLAQGGIFVLEKDQSLPSLEEDLLKSVSSKSRNFELLADRHNQLILRKL